MAHKNYRLNVGMNYPPNGKGRERRAEAYDIVNDLPPKSIPDLLKQGLIEEVADGGAQS